MDRCTLCSQPVTDLAYYDQRGRSWHPLCCDRLVLEAGDITRLPVGDRAALEGVFQAVPLPLLARLCARLPFEPERVGDWERLAE